MSQGAANTVYASNRAANNLVRNIPSAQIDTIDRCALLPAEAKIAVATMAQPVLLTGPWPHGDAAAASVSSLRRATVGRISASDRHPLQ